jgi:16S rRNA (cytidine1402-2'-O)-methyltransferase
MTGTLYVVATPIGNLADASPRSLRILREAALLACEDTRTTRKLLAAHGIAAGTLALHEHNERRAAARVLEALRSGRDVALVSDAGTPALSDPGAHLVAEAHREGIRVVPVPGPSAALAAWSAAGFGGDRFRFAGFFPGKAAKALDAIDGPDPVILYEAPHRVLATARALLERFGPDREVTVARELTKTFEEVARMPLAALPAWLEAGPHRQQGEFVLVLGPGEERARGAAPEPEAVLGILLESLPASEAARLAARITGAPKNALYRRALELARGSGKPEP